MKRTALLFRMKKLGIDPKLFCCLRDADRSNPGAQHACDLIPAC